MEELDYVGHYCSTESALKILASGNVRFSPMSRMNDPWESVKRQFGYFLDAPLWYRDEAPVAEMSEALNNNLKFFCTSHGWRHPEFADDIANPWNDPTFFEHDPSRPFTDTQHDPRFLNVPSTSTTTEEPCWARMRMWHQYGVSGTGACLLFDPTSLAEAVHSRFPYSAAGRVVYATQAQRMHITQATAFNPRHDVEDDDQAIREHIDLYAKDLTLIKSLDWANEHEFRFEIYDSENEFPVDVNFGNSLKEIILGLESDPIYHPSVLQFADSIPVHATDWGQRVGRLTKRRL